MQLTIPAPYLKVAAASAVAGAVIAFAISFTIPPHYVSTAVMRVAPRTVAGEPAWQIEIETAHRLQEIQTGMLSRASLAEIIRRPSMDLYREKRAVHPLEDVIDDMSGDLHIEIVPPPVQGKGRVSPAFRVSFEYTDRVKAQAVVREMTNRFSGQIAALTPANLPERPSRPDRLAITAIGLGVGLATGILFAFLRRRGPKWTLRMAGCIAAGCALAAAACLLMPDTFADDRKSYQFVALGAFAGLALGAFLLRARNTAGKHYARLIAFSAACGAIAGGLVSFAIPERYVSTAGVRAFPFAGGGGGTAREDIDYTETLRDLTDEILSRGSLSELIQRPSLDLYPVERFRRPMEDIVIDMRRRDIRIVLTPPLGLAGLGPVTNFQISFEYSDRTKARDVVRELVTKFTEGKFSVYRRLGTNNLAGSLMLEVTEAATLPASPTSPDRPAAAAIGLLAGMLLGSLLVLRRWLAARRVALTGPHQSHWRYPFAAAALGATAAGLVSLAIPSRYMSTAVLRPVPFLEEGTGATPGKREYAARLHQLTQEILSRSSLAELIQRPSLDLYRSERMRHPMEEIVDDMRRDLQVTPALPAGPADLGSSNNIQISFTYSDNYKAQALVREIVTKFTEGYVAMERNFSRGEAHTRLALEVLDPATLPESPVSPNRPAAIAIGLLVGMLTGSLLDWRRRLIAHRHAAALGSQPSYWKHALAAAVMGAIGACLASFAIPDRYVSTAVLRLVSADPRTPQSVDASSQQMQDMFRKVLSHDSLSAIIQGSSLQLYAAERRRHSLEELVKQMRERDLRVEPLRDAPLGGSPTAFRISFEYSDPEKACACVRAVVSQFVEGTLPIKQAALSAAYVPSSSRVTSTDILTHSPDRLFGASVDYLLGNRLDEDSGNGRPAPGAPYVEVLDPASMPIAPVGPNRMTISTAGGLAGLLMGIAVARARRHALHSAPA